MLWVGCGVVRVMNKHFNVNHTEFTCREMLPANNTALPRVRGLLLTTELVKALLTLTHLYFTLSSWSMFACNLANQAKNCNTDWH